MELRSVTVQHFQSCSKTKQNEACILLRYWMTAVLSSEQLAAQQARRAVDACHTTHLAAAAGALVHLLQAAHSMQAEDVLNMSTIGNGQVNNE
jgi:hypothetical protein